MSQALSLIQAELGRIQNDANALAQPVAPAMELPFAFDDDGAAAKGAASGVDFGGSFRDALQSVNARDRAAGERLADVDAGRSDDMVGAMLASQEAGLSFSMLMQVRNKVTGALDELIKLQL